MPEGTPLRSCKEAADEFCTKTSAPNTGKPDFESISAEGSLRKSFWSLPSRRSPERCKQADSCLKRVRSRRCSQILFLVLSKNLFKAFPSLPNKNLLCLAILQWITLRPIRESTSKRHSQGFEGRREHGLFELGNRVTISKYFREQGKKTNIYILGIKRLGTSFKVIWGTRKHKKISKGNKDSSPQEALIKCSASIQQLKQAIPTIFEWPTGKEDSLR